MGVALVVAHHQTPSTSRCERAVDWSISRAFAVLDITGPSALSVLQGL